MSNEEVVSADTIQLNMNNVLAAIIKTFGVVAVPIDDVLATYENQSLAISFDEDERKMVMTLVDNSQVVVEDES